MAKFTPTRKHNSCPICDDTTGKCRIVNDLILCMNFADSRKGETVNGYKCVGEADAVKQYFGSKWLLDNTAQWTEEKRREWEQQQELRQQQQAKEEEYKKGRSLSAEERDRNYRCVLDELELHPDDEADLVNRGFTPEQIIKSRFKSIKKGQTWLEVRINPNLPGASGGDGKHIFSPVDGYLCPVTDINGHICALQIRARNAEKGNRYRWINTKHQTLHLFPDGNKELPLAIYRSEGKSTGVILVEGTGAKPFLTANRLNKNVIGAAGGMFAASPTLLKQSLEALAEGEEINIPPDAGDVLNPVVIKRWKIVVDLIIKLGYNPVFLWWNQITKEDCDIDELTDYSNIKSISPDEFFNIAKKAQAEAKRAEEERQQRLKEEAENATYAELTGITEKPWLVVDTPKLELKEIIEPGAVYVIISAKGTNKTNAIRPVISRFNGVYAWFSRRALGNEECKRLRIDWDVKLGIASTIRIGFCADSAHKYNPEKLGKDGLLLVDEADQVFDHIFGDTCNKDGKRPMIQAHLEAHLKSAIAGNGAAVFMSADISQKEIDYIKELTPPGTPVRLIVNTYQPEKGDLYFDLSEDPDGQIEHLLSLLEDDIPCFVIDDIKNGVKGCKSIAEYIRTVHPEWEKLIVEINSDTSGSPEIISFLETINKSSEDKLLICCSPSVISGISIENGRFNEGVFGFFNGILTVSQASQALSRVRGAYSTYVWAAEEGLIFSANKATHPREISEYYQRNYAANSKHIQSFKPDYEPLTGEWSSPHWRLYCKNAAYRNLCMSKLRERLKTHLVDEGFTIFEVRSCGSDMVKNGLTSAWTKIELTEAEAVANAEIFTNEELDELAFSGHELTPEQKIRMEKTMLLKRFGQPLIEATTFEHKESGKILTGYAAMYLKNERGEYYKKLQNYHLLMSDQSEAIERDVARENRQLRHGYGRFVGDVRWQSRRRKCREWLGLKEFLKPGEWHAPIDYQELVGKAKSKAPMIKDCLGVNVENIQANAQVLTELAAQIGIDFDKRRVTGKKWKERKVNDESLKFAQMFVEHREAMKAEAEAKQAAYEASKSTSTSTSETVEVKVEVEPVVEVTQQPDPMADHPPLNLYTDTFLKGGCTNPESPEPMVISEVLEVKPVEKPVEQAIATVKAQLKEVNPESLIGKSVRWFSEYANKVLSLGRIQAIDWMEADEVIYKTSGGDYVKLDDLLNNSRYQVA